MSDKTLSSQLKINNEINTAKTQLTITYTTPKEKNEIYGIRSHTETVASFNIMRSVNSYSLLKTVFTGVSNKSDMIKKKKLIVKQIQMLYYLVWSTIDTIKFWVEVEFDELNFWVLFSLNQFVWLRFEAVSILDNILESTNRGLQQHLLERQQYFHYFERFFVLLGLEHYVKKMYARNF